MNYKEYGSANAKTILLLHGGGLSWWNYREESDKSNSAYSAVWKDFLRFGRRICQSNRIIGKRRCARDQGRNGHDSVRDPLQPNEVL